MRTCTEKHGQDAPGCTGSVPSVRPAAHWQAFLSTLGMFAAALLMGSGVVFFVAYNWDALDRFSRLGIGASAVCGATVLTLCTRPHSVPWRAGALLVCICTGALLALIGQIYQTGADIWQLFAAWAALILPVVLIGRTRELWLLWLLVAGQALFRLVWLEFGRWSLFLGLFGAVGAEPFAWLGVFYAAMLAVLHLGRQYLLMHPLSWLRTLLCMAALACLCGAAMFERGSYEVLYVVFALLCAWWAYQYKDSVVLAAVYVSVMALGIPRLGDWSNEPLLIAVWVLLVSGVGLRHALAVWREKRAQCAVAMVSAPPEVPQEAASPWWLNALMAFSAWLAAVLGIGGLAGLMPQMLQLPFSLAGIGVIAIGIKLMRQREEGVFIRQLGFAFSVVGQLWLSLGFADRVGSWSVMCFFAAAVAFVCSLARSPQTHRVLCLVAAWVCFLLALLVDYDVELRWMLLMVFAVSFAGWLCFYVARAQTWWNAFWHASTFVALLLAVGVPQFFSPLEDGSRAQWLMPACAALLWLGCLGALYRHRQQTWHGWMVVAIALSGLAWSMPFFLMALALALVLFERRQRVWLDVALLVCIALVGVYYYAMDVSLLHKSVSLMAAGAITALVTGLSRPRNVGFWRP